MPSSVSRFMIEYIDREAHVAYLEKALKAKKHEKDPSQSKEERQAAIKEIELPYSLDLSDPRWSGKKHWPPRFIRHQRENFEGTLKKSST